MDEKRGRGGRDEHGEGWGDRSRAHSDGASVEWELRDKTDITHTLLLIHGLLGMGLIGKLRVGFTQG